MVRGHYCRCAHVGRFNGRVFLEKYKATSNVFIGWNSKFFYTSADFNVQKHSADFLS